MKQFVMLLLVSMLTHVVNAEEIAAGEPSPNQGQVVDNRQERQEKRIENGIENGTLTEAEAKKLKKQQGRIQKIEERAEADGTISKKEKKHMQHALNNANRDIKRKKHNKRN